MATQLYLGNIVAAYTPPTIRGAWDQTAGAVVKGLTQQLNLGGAITSIAIAETNLGANWDVLLYRGVSDPLAAQTLTGNFDLIIGVLESNAAADFAYHIYAYVTQGDTDTPRGVLINDYVETTANEWPTTAAGRALAAAQAYSLAGILDGDRIVVEIGYVALNASATSRTGTIRYGTGGGSAGYPILSVGDTNVTFRSASLSFSNTVVFLSTGAGGWASPTATFDEGIAGGVATITFPIPTQLENGDLMVAGFAHRGAGYSTPPAGWTNITQVLETSSGLRGEVWWKRAYNEQTTFPFTGITNAVGYIRGYRGGLASGDPVDAVSTQGNATAPIITGPLTTTVEQALIIQYAMAYDANQIFGQGGGDEAEIDLTSCVLQGTTPNGAGPFTGVAIADGMMPMPGASSDWTWSVFTQGSTGANIGITVALKPEPTGGNGGGTKYFMTLRSPGSRDWSDSEYQGAWDRPADSPVYTGLPGGFDTWEVSQSKSGAGPIADASIATDQPGDSIMHRRYVTPRLEAQTIDGTFDLSFRVSASMNDNAYFPLNSFKCRYKVHIYISVGDTPAVRHTLLNNYVDSVDWSTTFGRMNLAAPQTLTPGVCQAGDRVVVEWGIFVQTLPTIPPNYPPDEWGFAFIRYIGTQQGTFATAGMGVAWTDPVVAYFLFSANLAELALPSPPPNETPGTAITIPALPYVEAPYDVSGAARPGKQTWYNYVAEQTGLCFFYVLGSNAAVGLALFQSPDFINDIPPVDEQGGLSWGLADYSIAVNLIQGQTYYIRVANNARGANLDVLGRPGNGTVRLGASYYSPPQTDDLFVPASNIYVLRDGVIVNILTAFRVDFATGIAIDFSGVALPDFNSPAWPLATNTDPKVYLALFTIDIVEILDGITLNVGEFEVNFIDFNVYNPNPPDTGPRHFACLDVVDGQLLTSAWGDGFWMVNGADNANVAAFFNAPASNQYYGAIRETSAYNVDTTGPWPTATPYDADVEFTTPWHIRVAPSDHDQILYVSGAFYMPEMQIDSIVTDIPAQDIKRFSRTTGQLSNFAMAVPLHTSPHEGLYGLDIHPNGDVIVCNGNRVDRLNAAGTVVQTYTPTDDAKCTALICVRYTHDGTKFWAFDQSTATLWQFDVSSGAVLQQNDMHFWSHVTTQMAIWLPEGIVPPGSCPGLVTDPRIDGLPYVPFSP